MANSNIMKEAFANLKFDKKIKEGAVTGKDYKDAKSFQQFYAETRKRCDRKKEIYQKVLDNYKPDRKLIRRLDATQLSESIRDPLDLSPSDQFIMLRVFRALPLQRREPEQSVHHPLNSFMDTSTALLTKTASSPLQPEQDI